MPALLLWKKPLKSMVHQTLMAKPRPQVGRVCSKDPLRKLHIRVYLNQQPSQPIRPIIHIKFDPGIWMVDVKNAAWILPCSIDGITQMLSWYGWVAVHICPVYRSAPWCLETIQALYALMTFGCWKEAAEAVHNFSCWYWGLCEYVVLSSHGFARHLVQSFCG